jgi:hypothetical protein
MPSIKAQHLSIALALLSISAASPVCHDTKCKSQNLDCDISSVPHPLFERSTWNYWWAAVTAEAVRTTSRLNEARDMEKPTPAEYPLPAIELPIFVMNRSDRPDRKEAISRLLARVGFTNVSFPKTIMWHDIHVRSLENSGKLHRSFRRFYSEYESSRPGYLPFIANALSQMYTIQAAVDSKLPLFGIFEDDLVQGSSLARTNCRIRRALDQLPSNADMLYLEVCHENCDDSNPVPGATSLLRLSKPQCTGAIIYTLHGAEKVLKLAMPVWDFIDRMYGNVVLDAALVVSVDLLPWGV